MVTELYSKQLNYLKDKGLMPSALRVAVLDYFQRYRSHPTADEIYGALKPEQPTLSKTSVYNTLGVFEKNKLVWRIGEEDGEARFDLVTAVHGHFKCRDCGKIFDVPYDITYDLDGFDVYEEKMFLTGLCPKCIEKKEKML